MNNKTDGNAGCGAAKRVAFTGVLLALALALGWAESLLLPLAGLPPGVKAGLANVVVMYAVFWLGARQAVLLCALKAGFAVLTRGAVAGLLSAAGGGISLALMLLLIFLGRRCSVLLISVAGALAHNMAQLAVVWLWFGGVMLYMLPPLIFGGVAAGCLTALLLRALLPGMKALRLFEFREK